MLESLTIYNFLFIFVCGCCFLGERFRIKQFIFFAYFLLFLVFSLRYDVGHDYDSYVKRFNYYSQLSGDEIFDLIGMSEPFTIVVAFFFSSSSTPYLYVFAIYALFHLIFLYKILERNSSHAIGLFVYFALNVFAFNLDGVRQGLAITLFLYVSRYIQEEKLLKSLIGIVLVSLIHFSALLMIPIYWLARLSIPKPVSLTIVLVFAVGYFFRIWVNFKQLIFSVIPYYSEKYEGLDEQMVSYEVSSGLGVLFNILLACLVIYFLTDKDKMLRNFAFFGIIVFLFANGNNNIERISNYFNHSLILSIPIVFADKRLKYIRIFLFIGLFILFQKNLISDPRGITPYQTVFSKSFHDKVFKYTSN